MSEASEGVPCRASVAGTDAVAPISSAKTSDSYTGPRAFSHSATRRTYSS